MNINSFFFILISFLLVLFVSVVPFITIDGGTVDDTLEYVKNLQYFPTKSAVFPLGYSLIIWVTNFLTNDYFVATKVIGILSISTILIFSFFKNFFFKETVLYLGFNTYTIFYVSLSESVYICAFYFLFYFIYRILYKNEINENYIIYISSLLIIFLFITRYSTLFLYLSMFIFTCFILLKNGIRNNLSKTLLKILFFSGIGIIVYLTYNYFFTGSLFGENQRAKSLYNGSNIIHFIIKQIIFPTINGSSPFIESLRVNKFWFYSSVCLALISFLVVGFHLIKILYNRRNNDFYRFISIFIIVYYLGLVYSIFDTHLEALHLRLISPILLAIYMVILINFKDKKFFNFSKLLIIPIISLLLNLYNLKSNYFSMIEKKENIKLFLQNNPQKKYYYNDINIIPTETGGVLTSNYYNLYLMNPNIIKLSEFNFKNYKQELIILESELVKIKPINPTVYANKFQIKNK